MPATRRTANKKDADAAAEPGTGATAAPGQGRESAGVVGDGGGEAVLAAGRSAPTPDASTSVHNVPLERRTV